MKISYHGIEIEVDREGFEEFMDMIQNMHFRKLKLDSERIAIENTEVRDFIERIHTRSQSQIPLPPIDSHLQPPVKKSCHKRTPTPHSSVTPDCMGDYVAYGRFNSAPEILRNSYVTPLFNVKRGGAFSPFHEGISPKTGKHNSRRMENE